MMDFRNARWADAAQTMINVEIERDGDWVTVTTSADDPGTSDLFAAAQAGGVADYAAPGIERLRLGVSLTRQEFCLALKRAGVLTGADAIKAAKGDWPSTFDAALPMLAAAGVDPDEAQITWASANIIERNHQLVGLMASVSGLSDVQVDALFGIGG